jgi:two-component system, NtrC family, sensor kinase
MPGRPGAIVRSRLFIKYVLLFVAVVSLALIANGAFDVYFSYQEQKASLVRIQREQAEAAGKIGQFISEIQSQVGWTTQLPWSASTLEQRRFDALRLLRQVPAITELAEIDSSGHEQLKVSRLAMEVVGSGNDYLVDQPLQVGEFRPCGFAKRHQTPSVATAWFSDVGPVHVRFQLKSTNRIVYYN